MATPLGQEARRCAEDYAPRLAELDDAGGVIAGKDLALGRGLCAFGTVRPAPTQLTALSGTNGCSDMGSARIPFF